MNKLTGFRKHNKLRFMSLVNKQGLECTKDEQIALALSEVFLIDNADTSECTNLKSQLIALFPNKDKVSGNLQISTDDVLYAMRATKPKPVDNSEVPPLFLKGMSGILAEPVAEILNLSLRSGVYPSLWKSSLVSPLYKGKGPKSIMGNFRPIANTYFLSKAFERIIKMRITSHLSQK